MGYKPGWIYRGYFIREVDSVIVLKGYRVDERGIEVMDTSLRPMIEGRIARKEMISTQELNEWYLNSTYSAEVNLLSDYYVEAMHEFSDWPFATELSRIKHIPEGSRTQFETMLWDFAHHPVNAQGFHSIPFTRHDSTRKSILLLGDSFMFGHTCDNFTQSTAQILLANGYEVWNTGISAADPAQYRAIAEWLIPELKPDYVVTNFFMGNDIIHYCREVKPNIPMLYETNAGVIFTCPEGEYILDPQLAYSHMINRHKLPQTDKRLLNRMMSWSAGTTQLWEIMRKNGFFKGQQYPEPIPGYFDKIAQHKTEYPCSLNDIKEIEKLAKENGTTPLLMIIPWRGKHGRDPIRDLPELKDFEYHFSPDISGADYHSDGHYNMAGHTKHARDIMALIGPPQK